MVKIAYVRNSGPSEQRTGIAFWCILVQYFRV